MRWTLILLMLAAVGVGVGVALWVNLGAGITAASVTLGLIALFYDDGTTHGGRR